MLFQARINSVQEVGASVVDNGSAQHVGASPLPKRATRVFGISYFLQTQSLTNRLSRFTR